MIHPLQARHAVKVELPQFSGNTRRDALQFLNGNSFSAMVTKISKKHFISSAV